MRNPHRPLTRELIVDTAISLVDCDGLAALTMRRLGERLDVEAMSLYRYVNGREDLLEGLVDRLVSTLALDPERRLGPADGWQAYLQWIAHAVRDLALAHPNAFPLIATRHPAAPWLRPPLRSLRVVEDFLHALTARGFSDRDAVTAYRVFSSFLLGHLLLECAMQGAETSPDSEPLDEGSASVSNADSDVEVEAFPHIDRLQPLLSENHADEDFERALEDLLDRLDLLVSE